MNGIQILALLPSGWKKSPSSNGDLQHTDQQSRLKPGDLSKWIKVNEGAKLRFNRLTKLPEYNGSEIPGELFDFFHVHLSEQGWDISCKNAQDALLFAAHENSYHPVEEYLLYVADDVTVEPLDIDKVAENFLGISDSLSNSMMAATLIGAAARVLEPGIKFDNCTVLKGEQGIGKSSFWQAVASPPWFTDTPQDSAKDQQLLIHTSWFIELAELESVTGKKEAGQLRTLLSSSKDSFRVPYGASIQSHKRQSIFVGSVNPDTFLKDQEGNRRFWVIELPNKRDNKIDFNKVIEHRDSIWKAAVIAYRSGRLPVLTYEEGELSEQRNSCYVTENIFLSGIERWLDSRDEQKKFTISEAIVGANLRDARLITQRDYQQAADALKQLGCVYDGQLRVNGNRGRYWSVPEKSRFKSNMGYIILISPDGIEVLDDNYPPKRMSDLEATLALRY
jgi:predicted P-loop ATPase